MNLSVKDKRMNEVKARLITLLSGGIFEYENNLYIKTDMKSIDLKNDTLCVNLLTGETKELGGAIDVTLVVADLVLYPNSCIKNKKV